jgi:hypothetical protein
MTVRGFLLSDDINMRSGDFEIIIKWIPVPFCIAVSQPFLDYAYSAQDSLILDRFEVIHHYHN